MRLTIRRAQRAATIAAVVAIATTTAGCGLSDPMSQPDTQPRPTTETTVAAAPVVSAAEADAVRRFADAYVDLLNGRGAPAERALHEAAAAKLADGLVMATQDAQLAGDASKSASTRILAVKSLGGGHWRATFATGATRWAMLLDVRAPADGPAQVTAAATQPAE